MIPDDDFDKSVRAAYRVAWDFASDQGKDFEPSMPLAGREYGPSDKTCVDYAELIVRKSGKARVISSATIKPGFASWLMVTSHRRTIAVNRKQIRTWARRSMRLNATPSFFSHLRRLIDRIGLDAGHDNNCLAEAMEARCILHELGHILLQPELLEASEGSGGPKHATPIQERAPWVFATTLLGIFLGEHACNQRTHKNVDDSPSRPI